MRKERVFICSILTCVTFFAFAEQPAEPPYVFSPKIGVCSSEGNAGLLKTNGYDYIELGVQRFLVPLESDEKFQKKFDTLKKHQFKALACNGFIPGSIKSTGPDADHDKLLEYAEVAFQRAKKVGINRIVFGSSGSRKIPEGFDRDMAKTQFIALLKRMGLIAKKYDVIVVIEPLKSKECNFINTVTEGAEIARAVDHSNIKLLADFYHMMQEGEGPESIIDAGSLLKHCHIAENEGRNYPGKNGEDFTGYFAALKKIKYKDAISIEGRWSNKMDDLQVARHYLAYQIAKVNNN